LQGVLNLHRTRKDLTAGMIRMLKPSWCVTAALFFVAPSYAGNRLELDCKATTVKTINGSVGKPETRADIHLTLDLSRQEFAINDSLVDTFGPWTVTNEKILIVDGGRYDHGLSTLRFEFDRRNQTYKAHATMIIEEVERQTIYLMEVGQCRPF
jgi:hypothetical protein